MIQCFFFFSFSQVPAVCSFNWHFRTSVLLAQEQDLWDCQLLPQCTKIFENKRPLWEDNSVITTLKSSTFLCSNSKQDYRGTLFVVLQIQLIGCVRLPARWLALVFFDAVRTVRTVPVNASSCSPPGSTYLVTSSRIGALIMPDRLVVFTS